jgi:transcriptional regulator with XRE-family HTH domain
MKAKSASEKIIFGLKVKQLRQKKQLSFSELSDKAGLSVSYLNEIEKGKKFPKEDKIRSMAQALNVPFEELTNMELNETLAPVAALIRSNFLNELPLDLFGIELTKVVEIIANAPKRVGAFISTLLELSRNYSLAEEHFFFGALRSFLEMHNNFFEELETAAEDFCEKHQISEERPISVTLLADLLAEEYDYEIVEDGLKGYPELKNLRSVFLLEKKHLLLNGQLSPYQRTFELGKELAFNYLQLKERAFTSSILKARSFEEVLNHSKAIYFSVALHIPRAPFIQQLNAFFKKKHWDGEAFLDIMKQYDATPEMFYHRLTNILPEYFGMKKLFFLRFVHDLDEGNFTMDKELHLNKRHHPHGNGLFEHYCRRWGAISLAQDLHQLQKEGKYVSLIARAQRSKYIGTEDEYLCFTIARPSYPAPNKNVSVTIGLLINSQLKKSIQFLEDPAIPSRSVNTTCERCALTQCEERAEQPFFIEKKKNIQQIQNRLNLLMQEN